MPSTLVDPATSIAFPKTLNIPSKIPLPTYTLLGLGVRTVSFLGIQVYSVGFYADLGNPRLNVSLPLLSLPVPEPWSDSGYSNPRGENRPHCPEYVMCYADQ
jgi:hypothetical protein